MTILAQHEATHLEQFARQIIQQEEMILQMLEVGEKLLGLYNATFTQGEPIPAFQEFEIRYTEARKLFEWLALDSWADVDRVQDKSASTLPKTVYLRLGVWVPQTRRRQTSIHFDSGSLAIQVPPKATLDEEASRNELPSGESNSDVHSFLDSVKSFLSQVIPFTDSAEFAKLLQSTYRLLEAYTAAGQSGRSLSSYTPEERDVLSLAMSAASPFLVSAHPEVLEDIGNSIEIVSNS